MTSRTDRNEQIIIALLEMALIIVKNTRKIRKQLEKKQGKKSTNELETTT